jgi:hypothetical protein
MSGCNIRAVAGGNLSIFPGASSVMGSHGMSVEQKQLHSGVEVPSLVA